MPRNVQNHLQIRQIDVKKLSSIWPFFNNKKAKEVETEPKNMTFGLTKAKLATLLDTSNAMVA